MTITCGEDRGAFGALARTGEANTLAEPDRTFRPDRPQRGRVPFDRDAPGLSDVRLNLTYGVTRFLEGESIRYDVRRGGGPMPPVDAIGELGVRFPAGDVAMREYARKGGDRPVPYSPEGTVTAFRGRGRRWVRPGRGRPPYRRHGPGAQRPPRHHPSTRQESQPL